MVSQKNGHNPRFGLSVRDIVVKGLRAPKSSLSQEISRTFDSATPGRSRKGPRVTGVRGLKRQVEVMKVEQRERHCGNLCLDRRGNQVGVAFALLISTKDQAETEPSRVRTIPSLVKLLHFSVALMLRGKGL